MKFHLIMFLLIFPAAAFSAPELKGNPEELSRYLLEERSIIIISGSGEEKVKADTAIVSLVVKTKDEKFKTALEKNQAIRQEIKKRLVAAGIAETKIHFPRYSSTPGYGLFGDKPTSYEISNEIRVAIEKEEHLLTIADIVDTSKEARYVKTELKDSKKKEFTMKAMEKSVEDISAKRQLYEKSLGATLVPVRVIEQAVSDYVPMLNVNSLNRANNLLGKSASYSNAPEAENIVGQDVAEFGEITYRATTRMEFILKKEK